MGGACVNTEKQGIQWMISFIVGLFAIVKCLGFYIKPSSERC